MRLRSTRSRRPGPPSTGCPTATGPGTSFRSRGPGPRRPGSGGSPGRSRRCGRAGPADRLDHRARWRSDRAWRHGPQAAGWAGRAPGPGPGGDPGGVVATGDQVLELGRHTGVQGWDDHAPPVHVGDDLAGVTFGPDPVAVHVARPGRMSLAPMSPPPSRPNESPAPSEGTSGGRRHHDRHLPATGRRPAARVAPGVTPTWRGRPGS